MFEGPARQSEDESIQSTSGLRWFAAYTASHHEKHVLARLSHHQVETFLPLYTESRRWSKRRPVDLSLPLFPNYIFVRIDLARRVTVLATPGVFSIVGSPQKAWELPDWEITALRNGIKAGKIRPHTWMAVGERARIKSGVLAGLEGVIIREKQNLRIVISLDQIMRSVAIEVDADELESAPAIFDHTVPSPRQGRVWPKHEQIG